MDRKRELTSVDIAALVGELGAYEGAGVDKAYLYPDDLLRLKLRHYERGRVELLVDVGETKHARIASPERVPPAPERPPNFAMMLRNRLAGAEFAGAEQFEFDRILQLHFEREDDSTTVVAELFGEGNVAVLDGAGEVVDCLETVRLKSRTVASGAPYEYPDARYNPLAVDFEGFRARFEQSDTDVVQTLATQLNFGGTWAEELCTRAGVEKTLPIADAGEDEYRRLYATVGDLSERVRAGDLDPRLYRVDDDPVDTTPVPMAEYEAGDRRPEAFDRFTEALDEYFTALEAAETAEEGGGGRDRPDFEAEIEKQKRIIDQQQGAIESFEQEAEGYRERAETLYAHYDLVDEVLSTIDEARADDVPWEEIEARFEEGTERGIPAAEAVQELHPEAGTVTVAVGEYRATLEVSEGVEHNADRLYQEAKRVEEKKQGAEEAIAETRAELDQWQQRREEWEAGDQETEDEDRSEADETVDWLSRSSVPIRSSEQWYEQFRWFHTSDDFLVIGGRDADDNEAIVNKYLETGDRFFHTQAHGGPATVLKTTGPSEPADPNIEVPDRSKEQAARFAVSYSSVWKDGRFAGDAYMVGPDQVTKTPESGEYLEKGGFAIRGDRTYFRDVSVGAAVGITCEPETRVIGGPPEPVRDRAEATIEVEPGRFAQNDTGKRLYREFREQFADESFVRKIASPDLVQEFLPPGGSRTVD